MREYCVEVVSVHVRTQPVFYAGPFLDVAGAERWINDNRHGFFKGQRFRIKQLIDVHTKQEQ
jgi:hypothetical protein